MRDLLKLPKAHLHLHFTGSMRHATLLELAARDGIVLPDQLVEEWPPTLSAADEKGWFRFQRLYDVARSVLRTEEDVRRLVREAAEDDVRDGGHVVVVDPGAEERELLGGRDVARSKLLDVPHELGLAEGRPVFALIKINPEALPFVMPPADGVILTTRFRQSVLGDEALYN